MSDSDQEVSVKVAAEVGDLNAGMASAAEAVSAFTTSTTAAFDNLAADTSAQIAEITNNVNSAFDDLGASSAHLDEVSKSLDDMGNHAKDGTEELKEHGEEASGLFGKLKVSAGEFTEAFKEQLEGLKGPFEFVEEHLKALAAILAGGAIFKKSVDEAVNFTRESYNMARQMGITADQASALKVAIEDAHVTTEAYMSANMRLTRQVKNNEEALNALGLVTRDANGHLLDQNTIMLNAIESLKDYKEGTDRNLVAQQYFGRGGASNADMLNITKEKLDEAREAQDRFNLTVGEEALASFQEYRNSMQDAHDVLDGIGVTIGRAVMPALTQFANWFVSVGPTAILVVKGAIGGFMAALDGIILTVNLIVDIFKTEFRNIVAAVADAAVAINDLFHGDVAGAIAAGKSFGSDIVDSWKQGWDEAVKDAEKTQTQLANLFGNQTPITQKNEGKEYHNPKDKSKAEEEGKKELEQLKQELEQKKLATADFHQWTQAEEAAFWQENISRVTAGTTARLEAENLGNKARRSMTEEAYKQHFDDMKAFMEQEQEGSLERLQTAELIAKGIGETYGEDSKQYAAAMKDLEKEAKAHVDYMAKLDEAQAVYERDHQLAMLDLESEAIKQQKNLDIINAEDELQRTMDVEEKKFEIKREFLQKQLAAQKTGTIEYANTLNEIKKLDDAFGLTVVKNSNDRAKAVSDSYKTLVGGVTNAIHGSVQGILQGTLTVSQALHNFTTAVLASFADMGAQVVAKWAEKELTQTALTAEGEATRQGIEEAGAIQSVAIAAWAAVKKIAIWAWQAAVGAYTWAVDKLGPWGAAGAAALALATVYEIGSHIAGGSGGGGGGGSVAGGGTVTPSAQSNANQTATSSTSNQPITNIYIQGDVVDYTQLARKLRLPNQYTTTVDAI